MGQTSPSRQRNSGLSSGDFQRPIFSGRLCVKKAKRIAEPAIIRVNRQIEMFGMFGKHESYQGERALTSGRCSRGVYTMTLLTLLLWMIDGTIAEYGSCFKN